MKTIKIGLIIIFIMGCSSGLDGLDSMKNLRKQQTILNYSCARLGYSSAKAGKSLDELYKIMEPILGKNPK